MSVDIDAQHSNDVLAALHTLRHQRNAFIIDLLETVMHTVLNGRGIYPARCFDHVWVYGVQSPVCRHPEVAGWIRKQLEAARPLLAAASSQRAAVERAVIAVLDPSGSRTIERYVFDLRSAGYDVTASCEASLMSEAEFDVRALLLRLGLVLCYWNSRCLPRA